MKTFTLRMNSVASVLRRLLGGAFCAQTWSVVALGLILLLGPSGASADIMDSYVFEPGTSLTFGSEAESVSGSFTYDATTNIVTVLTISLAGPDPYSGTYTSDTEGQPVAIISGFLGPYEELSIGLANGLGSSPDAIIGAVYQYESPTATQFTHADAVAGGVEFAPAPAVPEPSSVILLVTLVTMAGFLTRRKLVVGGLSKRAPDPTA